jgi:hypothetical protein
MGIDGEVLPPLSARTLAEMELGRQNVARAEARLKARQEAEAADMGAPAKAERPTEAHPRAVTLAPADPMPEPVPLPPPDEDETIIPTPKKNKK